MSAGLIDLWNPPKPPKIQEGSVTYKREQIGKNDYPEPKPKLTKEQMAQAREWFDGTA